MKLYRWIDSLFATPDKRRFILVSLLSLYWLWQLIWQIAFFGSLFQVQDYESLFQFMGAMQGFQSSLLVRFAYSLISNPLVQLSSLWNAVWSALTPWDAIVVLGSLILLPTISKGKQRIFIGGTVFLFGIIVGALAIGMKSSSVQALISLLRILSVICLAVCVVLAFSLAFFWIHRCLYTMKRLRENRK